MAEVGGARRAVPVPWRLFPHKSLQEITKPNRHRGTVGRRTLASIHHKRQNHAVRGGGALVFLIPQSLARMGLGTLDRLKTERAVRAAKVEIVLILGTRSRSETRGLY